jgi:uncharacterized OsmC-like protein
LFFTGGERGGDLIDSVRGEPSKENQYFDQLKIKLTKEEEKAIDYRNYLLHGNILMNNESERTSEEIDNHILHVSAKLACPASN